MKDIINKNRLKVQQIIKKFTGEYNEDLEQEVYTKAFKNLDKYEERNKFSQWIATISANLCRDYLRSAGFQNIKNTVSDEENLNLIKTDKTPEKELTQKERQKIILAEVNSLPKKLKEAIILFEFEEYSYETISRKLNIPIGTVKSRINSARKILKEKLSYLLKEEIE